MKDKKFYYSCILRSMKSAIRCKVRMKRGIWPKTIMRSVHPRASGKETVALKALHCSDSIKVLLEGRNR